MTSAYWRPKGIPKLPRAIADAASDGNLVMFVGAGVSIQMGCPSWEQFVEAIDTKELIDSPARLEKITDYIIDHHPIKTRNNEFTAMMCVSSVDVLIKYYELFSEKK